MLVSVAFQLQLLLLLGLQGFAQLQPPAHHVLLRQGRRTHMEDRVTVWHGSCPDGEHSTPVSVYAVYDGHASHAISDQLSRRLHEAVIAELAAQASGLEHGLLAVNHTQALQAAFERVDDELAAEAAHHLPAGSGPDAVPADDPGSTAVLALLLHEHRALVVANVGNSRALLCSSKEDSLRGERGQLRSFPLTRPHELWQQDERERVLRAGGIVTGGAGGRVARLEGDLELSRALGDLRYRDKGLIATPEVEGPLPLDKGDEFLILASDGVFEVLSPAEVCAHAHAVATGRSHPALSAPRPPAIPLYAAPPSGPRFRLWHWLQAALQPWVRMESSVVHMLSAIYNTLASVWSFDFMLQGHGNTTLPGCCDCGGKDTCHRQALAAERRARKGGAASGGTCARAMDEAVAWRLIQEAYNRGSTDNLAVITVDLTTLQDSDTISTGPPPALAEECVMQSSWPVALANQPVLFSTCLEATQGAEPGSCAWTLHSNDDQNHASLVQLSNHLSHLPASPQGAAYILTKRLATVPSLPSWHAHIYGDSCASEDGEQLALTWPLDLSVLATSWTGQLAQNLLLPSGSADLPETTKAAAPPSPPGAAAAMAHVDAVREWNGLLDLLASVCLIRTKQLSRQWDASVVPANDTGVCTALELTGADEVAPVRGPVQPAAVPPNNGPADVTSGRPTVPAGPVLTAASPPQMLPGQLEPEGHGSRRGRALLIHAELEEEDLRGLVDDAHVVKAPRSALTEGVRGSRPVSRSAGEGSSAAGQVISTSVNVIGGQRTFLGHDALYQLKQRRGQGHFGEVWQAVQYSGQDGGTTAPPCPNPQNPTAPCGPLSQGSAGTDASPNQDSHQWASRGRFVLKRLLTERGAGVKLSGLREVHFGELLRRHQASADAGVREPGVAGAGSKHFEGLKHLVRYVESFQATSSSTTGAPSARSRYNSNVRDNKANQANDLWLVFHDEGTSLHDLMYAPVAPAGTVDEAEPAAVPTDGMPYSQTQGSQQSHQQQQQQHEQQQQDIAPGFQIMGPSKWWHDMRQSPKGPGAIRSFVRQLLLALDALHTLNITHRDVKPENMLLQGLGTWMREGCGDDASGRRSAGVGSAKADSWRPSDAAGKRASDVGSSQAAGNLIGAKAKAKTGGVGGSGLWEAWRRHTQSAGSGPGAAQCGRAGTGYHLRLIDLGSATDRYSLQHLYGSEGPSAAQLTLEYAPPEALFGRYWEGIQTLKANAWAHDIWAAGVVWLELLLATPHVFQLPPHTRALIDIKLRMSERSEGDQQLLYLLRGMMEWCVYPAQVPSKLRGRRELISWSCTDQALLQLIKARDPTGIGIESLAAVSLLRRLLHWEPGMRPTARQALNHAYFSRPAPVDLAHCAAFGEEGWC